MDAQDLFWRRRACSPGHPQIRTRSAPEPARPAVASRPGYPVHPVYPCFFRFFCLHGCTGYTGFFWTISRRLASCNPGHPQIRTRSAPEPARPAVASRPGYPVHPVYPCFFRFFVYMDVQDIQDFSGLFPGVWRPVILGIRKPERDQRRSQPLAQQPPVLIILSILCIHVQ